MKRSLFTFLSLHIWESNIFYTCDLKTKANRFLFITRMLHFNTANNKTQLMQQEILLFTSMNSKMWSRYYTSTFLCCESRISPRPPDAYSMLGSERRTEIGNSPAPHINLLPQMTSSFGLMDGPAQSKRVLFFEEENVLLETITYWTVLKHKGNTCCHLKKTVLCPEPGAEEGSRECSERRMFVPSANQWGNIEQ